MNAINRLNRYNIAVLTSVLFLNACGGSSSGDDNNSSASSGEKRTLFAQDVDVRTAVNSPLVVDLSEKVIMSGDGNFRLTQLPKLVTGTANSCRVDALNDNKTALSVSSDQVSDCIYEYEVESSTHNSTPVKAYLRVGVSNDFSDNSLPKITKSLSSLSEVNIDIKAELALASSSITSADLEGFELQNDIVVFGEGYAEKNADGTLRYVPSVEASYVTILFSLTKENNIKFGTLLLSVSDPVNDNKVPVAQNFSYPEALQIISGTGRTEIFTFDIANTGNADMPSLISDEDSQALQLVNIQSTTSIVKPVDADDITNTRFTFQSSTPGWNDVIYTVSDHDGGYAIGTFSFYVEADYTLIQYWTDIITNDPTINRDITFLAPLTVEAANYLNIGYIDGQLEADIVGNPTVMRMSYEQAEAYCAARDARLPTLREFQLLNTQEGDVFENHTWPKTYGFWTTKKLSQTMAKVYRPSEYDLFPLGSEEELSYTDLQGNTNSRYVTCILLEDGVSNFKAETTVESDSVINIKHNLETILYDPEGELASYHFINLNTVNKVGSLIPSELNDGAKVYTDGNASYQYSYIDHSFNNEIVQVTRYGNLLEEVEVVPVELNAPRVDFDASKWARGSYEGGFNINQFPIEGRGLPIWNSSYLPTNNSSMTSRLISIYKPGFVGRSFMGRIKVTQYGPNAPRVGRFVLSLQQATSNDPGRIQGEWDMPGLTSDEKQMAIIYDYKDESLYVLNRRYDPDTRSSSIKGLRQEYAYLWFIYSDSTNTLRIYVSANDKRPSCPMKFGNNYHADIGWGSNMMVNSNNPYYLTVSSRIQTNGNEPYANTVFFEYIDFVSWTDTNLDLDASEITTLCEN